jgi:hypothetical protein
MEQALALGSVIPAALGASCCAATKRPNWDVHLAMGVMVLAMIDTMLLDAGLLPVFAWTVMLAGAGVTLLITRRHQPMGAERAVHLGLMALLTAAMGLTHAETSGDPSISHSHMAHSHGLESAGGASDLSSLLVLAVLIAVWWSAVLLTRAWRCFRANSPGEGIVCAERALGAVSLLGMSAMLLVMNTAG